MSYTPNNACVYAKAFSGCLAGLGGGGKYLDAVAGDESGYARMADTYAQEFDTVWGAPVPTAIEEDSIVSISFAVWRARSPLESSIAFLPGAYFGIVSGVIALVQEGNAQVVSEGIDPNGCGSGLVTFGSNWISVPAGTTKNAIPGGMYAADSTGALTQFLLPSTPPNGSFFLVKLIGGSIINPMEFKAGTGDTVEDPQNPGVFSTVAGSVFVATIGAIAAWKYDTPNRRWIQFIS